MSEFVTQCPICGGEIQATRKEYMGRLILDRTGDVIDDGHWVDSGDTEIYCENDHTIEEIREALTITS